MNPTIKGFIKKELRQSLRDPRMRMMLVAMPIVQLCLFGFALSTETKNIRMGARIEKEDVVLRDIYEKSIASGWFVETDSKQEDPFAQVVLGDAEVVLVAPEGGLTKSLVNGHAKLQVLIDSSDVIKAQSVSAYITGIANKSISEYLGQSQSGPFIEIKHRVLFNPSLETSAFMVPGIMAMIMLVTTLIMANVAIVREKELGTFEMLIAAPISKGEIILGKTIPYVVLGMLNLPLILGAAVAIFDVPMRGSLFAIFIAALAFNCVSVAIGTMLSTIASNQQQATLAAFLLMFPMIMFSGLMFPVENMPDAIRWIGDIDPLMHFMGLLRNIMLKGGGFYYVIKHTAILVLMAIVAVLIARRRFHTTL